MTTDGSLGLLAPTARAHTETDDFAWATDAVYYSGHPHTDVVWGSRFGDWFWGHGGPDRLYGFTGADQLTGGDGHDRLYGQDGNDVVFGGDGDDVIYCGNGDGDWASGGRGLDIYHDCETTA